MNPPREIGPFEILDRLGAGGMGEVWRARDTRLNRFVAIKFLPEAAGATARERFQREALAIAALNHPNICTLYEAGEHDGQAFLVMEMLEGETLHDRLQHGPAAVSQVTTWAAEIADALEAAHAKGILHRDLKPANIFITQRGAVKVLDFGLAQFALAAADDAEAPTVLTASPALGPLTTPGTTMGTYAYMSPEQARGEATDARSDIFSLGAVLYEAAAGKPVFSGRTTADLTAAVLTFTPPAAGAGRLDDIIARCLEKDPALRYQSAADLHSDLKRLQASTSHLSAPTAPAAAPARRRAWLWALIASIVIAAALWFALRPRTPAMAPRLSFRQLTFSGHVVDAVISPDGKFLAHVDATPQGDSLHLLSIASGSDIQIVPPGGGCCHSPAFSPDGGSVYFLEGQTIRSTPVLGGGLHTIVATGACSGAGFSRDGSQIAYVARDGYRTQLVLARPDGSQAHVLATAPVGSGFTSYCWGPRGPSHSPSWSSDEGWIVLANLAAQGSRMIAVSTRDGSLHRFGPEVGAGGATDVSWLPGTHTAVFTASIPRSGARQLWEVSYPSGHTTQLTSDLQGYASVSAASSGELLVVHSAPQHSIWQQSRPGGEFTELPGAGATQDGATGLDWTASGDIVATRNLSGDHEIWQVSGAAHRLIRAPHGNLAEYPLVTPSGQVVFLMNSISRINADGSGLTGLLRPAPGWSVLRVALIHDGHDVAYLSEDPQDRQTIWSVPVTGGVPHQLWPAPGQQGFVGVGALASPPGGGRIFAFTLGATPLRHGVPTILNLLTSPVTAVTVPGLDRRTTAGPYGLTPDGKAVAYVVRHGSVDNLWAYPITGGQPYPLTHFSSLRIAAYAFARDGRLAVSRGSENSDAVLVSGMEPKQP